LEDFELNEFDPNNIDTTVVFQFLDFPDTSSAFSYPLGLSFLLNKTKSDGSHAPQEAALSHN
jgi:hypothetical protein